MKHDELTSLRYRNASLVASDNTSRGQKADSQTILNLLDHISFQEDEIDRLQKFINECPDCRNGPWHIQGMQVGFCRGSARREQR